MIRIQNCLFSLLLLAASFQLSKAQDADVAKLVWEVNKVDLGTVLEEQGAQVAEFKFTHTQDSIFFVEKVWTDCGCTTVDYTEDSLHLGESGTIRVSFDPSSGSGYFSRLIVVKGNLSGVQDSLFIEGVSVPFPEDPATAYSKRQGQIGFRLDKVNMGDVLTNEPKAKFVEIYNFGNSPINRSGLQYAGPENIQVSQIQQVINPQERGLLEIRYDGAAKSDLGFFEDQLVVSWGDEYLMRMNLVANVFEYFPPTPKSELGEVPQLDISPREIDLREIDSNEIQTKTFTLRNKGRQPLEIRKVQGNCDCISMEIPETTIAPGQSLELKVSFDPKGRKGIDQRNIHVFRNDPINSVQMIVLKSRVNN